MKNWVVAINGVSRRWRDDMLRMSFDESTEPLVSR
jgi:hypothetical protein